MGRIEENNKNKISELEVRTIELSNLNSERKYTKNTNKKKKVSGTCVIITKDLTLSESRKRKKRG